jgi:valyl-tRNA synthetase
VVASERGPIEVLVGLRGLVTKDGELARVDRELKKIDKELGAVEKKLSSPGFVDRAPKDVVEEAMEQRLAFHGARQRLEAARKLAEEL